MHNALDPRRLLAAVLLAAGGLAPAGVTAQSWPARPIKLVVPFAPGGGNDILARALAPRLQKLLGQPVLVENKPGAGGNLGAESVARAPADGYTLVIASNQNTINPAIGIKTSFKVDKDFAPVGLVASVPLVLAAHPGEPYKTLPAFIDFAKRHPGKLSYSSPGNGTPQHLAGEAFAHLSRTKLVHVPYRGTGPALSDLVGGQVQVSFATMASVMPFIESGRLRALGIAGQKRSAAMPQLPTFGEVGLKSYDAALWYCLLAPSATPQAVVTRLNTALVQTVRSEDFVQAVAKQGFEPASSSPAELKAIIDKDLARWARFVADTGIKVEQ